jgi:hypothetical protein
MNHKDASFLTDPNAPIDAVLGWYPHKQEHLVYADRIDGALQLLPADRKDREAAKWARSQLTTERRAVEAELERVADAMTAVEAARETARAAMAVASKALAAIAQATKVDDLLRARAQHELDCRVANAAINAFRKAAKAAAPKSIALHPLYRGAVRAGDTLDFLKSHEGALDELDPERHSHAEGTAHDGARSYAADALIGDVPWVIADVGDEQCRVYRLWLSVVGPRHGFDAPSYDDIFADVAAE